MRKHRFDFQLIARIFLTFLKISPVTFGGGYAMIPLIEKEVVDKRKWLETKDLADVFALAESVPGAIALNSSIFIGYRLAGVAGALAAMFGTLLPTFFIVLLLSILYLKMKDHPKVEAAFVSIRVTVVALITYAAIKIGKTAAIDVATVALIAVTAGLMWFVDVHPILLIIGGGCLGIVIVAAKQKFRIPDRWVRPAVQEEVKPEKTAYRYADYYFGDGI